MLPLPEHIFIMLNTYTFCSQQSYQLAKSKYTACIAYFYNSTIKYIQSINVKKQNYFEYEYNDSMSLSITEYHDLW